MKSTTFAHSPELSAEKKALEGMRRESPVLLHEPLNLRVDWFLDSRAGGSRFKTWAGQQSVLDIAQKMQAGVAGLDSHQLTPSEILGASAGGCGLPFYFDATVGGQGSPLDIGFSLDPLAGSALTRIEGRVRPALELLAFIGLQRFRPRQLGNENLYRYRVWRRPLPPELAAPAVSGSLPLPADGFEFRLLYRTKYLKSFLPATPCHGDFCA